MNLVKPGLSSNRGGRADGALPLLPDDPGAAGASTPRYSQPSQVYPPTPPPEKDAAGGPRGPVRAHTIATMGHRSMSVSGASTMSSSGRRPSEHGGQVYRR